MTSIFTKKTSWLIILWVLLIILVVTALSILASVPPVSRDALAHHLAIPKLYLDHGGIYEIPYLRFSYYPMNVTLLYAIPLYFGNDILPKFIHFAFALATVALIYQYLARRINLQYALLGSLFFLSIPVIVRLSSTVYVDLGLIFFLFAALLYLFRWIESNFSIKYLLVAAIFCGLALGTKYNGLIGLFLLGLFIAFVYARFHAGQKWSNIKAAGWCAAFAVVALIVFSPWIIRNVHWTGNPVYPLYNSLFAEKNESEEVNEDNVLRQRYRMSHIQIRHQVYGESWLEIVLIPVRVFFQGKDDDPQYFDGKTNPFLLLLPIFAFFGIRATNRQEKTEKLMMFFFAGLFLLYACAQTSIRIRYFSPILPPLVVLSMFGLYNLQTSLLPRMQGLSEPMKKFVLFGIVFVMLGLNALYMVDRFKKDQPLAYITGKVTRDQYIQAYRPEYASFQYANKNLGADSKILGLYIAQRGYYSNIDIAFPIQSVQDFASIADSGADIVEQLHEQGFTHILVNFSLFNYWVQEYSKHERRMLKDFFDNYTVLEFSTDGYGLLKISKESIR